jgi:hypothetical protein
MIVEPKDAHLQPRKATMNSKTILERRTGHTYPAAFPQIGSLYGAPGVRLRDRSGDEGRRVGAWRSPGLKGRVSRPANGQPESASSG